MDQKVTRAKQTYELLCKSFDNKGWHYTRHEEDQVITCSMQSNDLPIEHIVRVCTEQQVLVLYSKLPLSVPADKAIDVAVAVCVINDKLADGSFDFDIERGSIVFRQTTSFMGSELGEDLFPRMVAIASTTVDVFNDKLFMLVKGMLSIEQFLRDEL